LAPLGACLDDSSVRLVAKYRNASQRLPSSISRCSTLARDNARWLNGRLSSSRSASAQPEATLAAPPPLPVRGKYQFQIPAQEPGQQPGWRIETSAAQVLAILLDESLPWRGPRNRGLAESNLSGIEPQPQQGSPLLTGVTPPRRPTIPNDATQSEGRSHGQGTLCLDPQRLGSKDLVSLFFRHTFECESARDPPPAAQPARRNSRCCGWACGPTRPLEFPSH